MNLKKYVHYTTKVFHCSFLPFVREFSIKAENERIQKFPD